MQRIKVCILRTVVLRVVYKLFRIVRLSYGVMVALQFLVLSVVVRVRLGQQKAAVEVIRSLLFVGVCFVWLYVKTGSYNGLLLYSRILLICLLYSFVRNGNVCGYGLLSLEDIMRFYL